MKKIPLVSIICTSYNHEAYIKDAIEGFIMQKTSFPFEIIIHDDASIDNTGRIIKEYENKYPELFVTIYQTENQYSKKNVNIWTDITFPLAKGKYIALCEGDDYWTDPMKLQKQVDFLEANEDIVWSSHQFFILNNDTQELKLAYNKYFKENKDSIGFFFSQEDAIFGTYGWIIKTLASVIRTKAITPKLYPGIVMQRDVHLFYDVLSKGKGYCHSFVGGVYRIHSGGIFSNKTIAEKEQINLMVYREFYKYEKSILLKRILQQLYCSCFIDNLRQMKFIKPVFGFEFLALFKCSFQKLINKITNIK